MVKKNYAKTTILIALALLLFLPLIHAQPKVPMEIYGEARLFNAPVPQGTTIHALNMDGEHCGRFTVTHRGFFGTMSCMSENTTQEMGGASPNEIIRFRIGNFPASTLLNGTAESIGNLNWESGTFEEVILVSPPLVCGDGFCDTFENCHTCPEDCGECPEGEGDGTGVDDITSDPTLGLPEEPPLRPEPETQYPEEECIESWTCSDWGPCQPEGIQTRTCIDENDCGTEDDKPETERECEYQEPENITITEPEPTPPRVETPISIEKCEARLPFWSMESLTFFILFTMLILGPLAYLTHKKRKIKKEKLKKTDELIKIYKLENKIYTAIIIISVLSIIVYLYHYFFYLCPEVYYNNLWLLLGFILLSPIIINVLIHILKYSERKKLTMVKLLKDTHYNHLKYLLTLINKDLTKSEVEISNKIYALNNKNEFSDVISKTKELKKIYGDLLKIYSLYSEGKDSFKVEKDLIEQIEILDKDEQFNKVAEEYPELKGLKDNILLLYEAETSKQELLKKIKETEKQIDQEGLKEEIKEKPDERENTKDSKNKEDTD